MDCFHQFRETQAAQLDELRAKVHAHYQHQLQQLSDENAQLQASLALAYEARGVTQTRCGSDNFTHPEMPNDCPLDIDAVHLYEPGEATDEHPCAETAALALSSMEYEGLKEANSDHGLNNNNLPDTDGVPKKKLSVTITPTSQTKDQISRFQSQAKTTHPDETSQPVIRWIVYRPWCNHVITLVIFLNAATIGVETEWRAQHVGQTEPDIFENLNTLCNVVFIVEWVLRIHVERCKFCWSRDWKWNLFDTFIVLMAIFETLLGLASGTNFDGGSGLRALRLLRLVRTVRVLRTALNFRELRLIVTGIGSSVAALCWLMVLLAFIMYIFAVVIARLVTDHKILQNEAGLALSESDLVDKHFGSLAKCMYSLYLGISGGENWGVFFQDLNKVSPFCGAMLMCYIAFVTCCVLNVVTGVFCDNASRAASDDIDFVVLEMKDKQKKHVSDVCQVFSEADSDGSGSLSRDEFVRHIADPRIQSYFKFIQLDLEAFVVDKLFSLLDFDGGMSIELEEFVVGCSKFRGYAKSLDVAALHHDVKLIRRAMGI